MSEDIIVRHCSPTLAGLKTGSLFTVRFETEQQLRSDIRRMNRRLSSRGVRVLPLRISGGSALIYVYRPTRLKKDLGRCEAASMLCDRGYCCENPGRCIVRLAGRIREHDGFPHEIGLFLGYPPEDVRGFIEKGAAGAKLSGYWKVYGDEDKARRIFAQYKKCTDEYVRCLSGGTPLEKLTVAM